MAQDDPKPRRQAWRNQGSEQPAAVPGLRAWQQHRADAAQQPPRRWSKRTKLTLATTLLAGVVAGIVAVILVLWPIKPACIILVGSGYDKNLLLPPNVLGRQGMENIKAWTASPTLERHLLFFDDATRLALQQTLEEPKTLEDWQNLLNAVSATKRNQQTLIIYLSLHGGADADRGAYLLANAEIKPIKLYLDDLFKAFQATELKAKKIVLVLDAPHFATHWPIGIFQNNFVAQLKSQFKDLKSPNVFVLCACSENEISWASEEWQSTTFAQFFLEALQGAADGANKSRPNNRIDLAEVTAYLEEKVNAWANKNRSVLQRPFLLSNANPENVELVIVDNEKKHPVPRPVKSLPSPELKTIWSQWQELKDQTQAQKTSGPWTFAPHLWRRYQDAIVRLEYLERAGEAANVSRTNELRDEIDELYKILKRLAPCNVDPKCLSSSIPLARALGHAQPMLAAAQALWEQRDDPQWPELLEKVNKKDRQEVQTELGSLLLDDLCKDLVSFTKKDEVLGARLAKAVGRWKTVEKALDQPRSAELHFLMMVDQFADKQIPSASVVLALQVRRLAEETALGIGAGAPDGLFPYSEFICAWTAADLREADKRRREGEDLLFGAPKHWEKAGALLADAREKYEAIQKDAEGLRKALATRDRVWAELPYLAQWFARQPAIAKDHSQKLLALADNLNRLTRHLEMPGKVRAPVPVSSGSRTLEALSGDIERQHGELCNVYLSEHESLVKPVVSQTHYHNIEAALSVPGLLKDSERKYLISNSQNNSAELNKPGGGAGASLLATDVDQFKRHQDFAQAVYKSLLEKAPTLEAALAELPITIQEGLRRGLQSDNLKKAKELLAEPARFCRLVPGGFASRTTLEDKDVGGAPQSLRQLLVHDLLLGLAKRTFQDHWYMGNGTDTYYIPVGQGFARSAQKLVNYTAAGPEINAKRLAQSKDFEKKLVPTGLKITTPRQTIDWTTEQEMRLDWQVSEDEGLPKEGFPIVWQKIGQGASPVKQKREQLEWSNMTEPTIVSEKDWSAPDKLLVALNGFFRGQEFGQLVDLIKKAPTLEVRRLLPPKDLAGLAVRMDKAFTYGAVSIVLDTSGSMAWEYPTVKVKGKDGKEDNKAGSEKADNRRFDFARKALLRIVDSLPKGTRVSLLGFDKTTTPVFIRFGKQNVVEWDADLHRKPLEGELDAISKAISKPDYNVGSPIADTVVKSMREGFGSNYAGPKLTLVLTDGCDNAANEKVVDKLQRANREKSDVNVVVLCFIPKDDDDYATAQKQWQVVDTFGRFILVEDARRLEDEVEEYLSLQLKLKGKSGRFDGVVNRKNNLDFQKLPPDDYDTTINNKSGTFAEVVNQVSLAKGELVLTILKSKGKELHLERGIIGRQSEVNAPHGDEERTNKDWLATLLLNSPDSTLEQLLLIESTKTQGERKVKQIAPAMVWLEVEPGKSKDLPKRPSLVQWHNDWNIPAPALRLFAKNWPTDGQGEHVIPKLKAWWGDYPGEQDVDQMISLTGRQTMLPFEVGGKQGFIESVNLEKHQVMTAPGIKEVLPCLVVRVKHEQGNPVWIHLENSHLGAEHRYFESAGKYTATFYSVSEIPSRLSVMCVNSFKNNATKAGMAVTITAKFRVNTPQTFIGELFQK